MPSEQRKPPVKLTDWFSGFGQNSSAPARLPGSHLPEMNLDTPMPERKKRQAVVGIMRRTSAEEIDWGWDDDEGHFSARWQDWRLELTPGSLLVFSGEAPCAHYREGAMDLFSLVLARQSGRELFEEAATSSTASRA